MKPLTIQGVVLVLMLLALPLTSLGTAGDQSWAQVAGIAVLGLAALVPPVMRFAGPDEDGEGADDAEGEDAEPTQEEQP